MSTSTENYFPVFPLKET